jgi:PAS domain S-box-containing protein
MRIAVEATERHELQSALWDTNQRITSVLESITDAFIALDRNRIVTWMNREAARMLACDPASLIGRDFEKVLPAVVSSSLHQRLMRCMAQCQTDHFEEISPIDGMPLELHAYGSEEGLSVYFHDITDRRRMQQELQSTNRRIISILESITDAFIAIDRNHLITWMNQAAARIIGSRRELIVGRKVEEALPVVIGNPIYERVMRALEQGTTEHFEALPPDVRIPIEVHAYSSGEGLSIYFHDISERKGMEEALHSANAYLSGVLESITDAFYVLDREHRITWLNQEAADMLGIDRDAVMGKAIENVLGPHASADVTQRVMHCMQECSTAHLEYYSDIVKAYVEMHVYGWKGGVAVHFRDVSERKKLEEELHASEQHFRGIFQCNMMGMAIAHITTGLIVDANDTYLGILGYTREDLKEGKVSWLTSTPPDWMEVTRRAHERIDNGQRDPYEKEYFRKDGQRVSVMVGGAPLTHESADLAIVFMIDRTEAKRAQRKQDELHQLLHAVMETTPVSTNVLDLQGRVIIWNDAAANLFGWTKQEVLGKPVPMVPAQYREKYARLFERRLAGESFSVSGVPCHTKDGPTIMVDLDYRPIRDDAGKVIALMTLAHCATLDRKDLKIEPWAKQ